MGKCLSKKDLLAEIAVEKDKLDKNLAKLTENQMTVCGVSPGGWSVKDILGHLIGWQNLNLGWCEADKRGEMPHLPATGYSWRDTAKLNNEIYHEREGHDLASVLSEFDLSHERMLILINEADDEAFATVGYYKWAGTSWSLSDYIRANTASHYRWANNHIVRWLRKI